MHPVWQQWQEIVAFGIVAVAFWVVGRRLWTQITAFRKRPARRPSKRASAHPPMPPTTSPLIQLQIKPPAHLKRPPPDGRGVPR